MMDKNLARSAYLAAIALAFGLPALNYPRGTLSKAGPGFFPLMLSSVLLALALLAFVRSRIVKPEPLSLEYRNIGLILVGLIAFAVVSMVWNMSAGIAVMVFLMSFAGKSRNWRRSLQVAVGLIAVAFVFRVGLGLNLPLY